MADRRRAPVRPCVAVRTPRGRSGTRRLLSGDGQHQAHGGDRSWLCALASSSCCRGLVPYTQCPILCGSKSRASGEASPDPRTCDPFHNLAAPRCSPRLSNGCYAKCSTSLIASRCSTDPGNVYCFPAPPPISSPPSEFLPQSIHPSLPLPRALPLHAARCLL